MEDDLKMDNHETISTNINTDSDFVSLSFKNFSASEMDIFLAICYKCQRQKADELIIPITELRQLTKYRNVSNKDFVDAIRTMAIKLFSLDPKIKKPNTKFSLFIPFVVFEFDLNVGLKVKMNDEFSYLFDDFLKDYTVSDIKESVTLSSSYAKRIYRVLRYLKRNNQPAWIVSLEDFRIFVNLPESYKMGNIDQRVLEPSIKELLRFFPNLKVEKLYSTEAKRGRPSVLGLKFTFDKVSTRRKKDNYDDGTIDRY